MMGKMYDESKLKIKLEANLLFHGFYLEEKEEGMKLGPFHVFWWTVWELLDCFIIEYAKEHRFYDQVIESVRKRRGNEI